MGLDGWVGVGVGVIEGNGLGVGVEVGLVVSEITSEVGVVCGWIEGLASVLDPSSVGCGFL